MQTRSDILELPDGTRLKLHDWPLERLSFGRVLIVHGLGEHGGRYAQVAAALNRAGWQVQSYDHRGHGQSSGARGAIPRAEALCEDLAAVIDALRDRSGPLVLLGHSMGGLIAARFVAEALGAKPAAWSHPVDALVLSSPALDPGMNGFQKALLALLGPIAPDLAVNNGLKPDWISRDPEVVRAYVADALVHDRVTPRLVRSIVDAGRLATERAPRWKVPTLLMWAGADRCVAPAGSAAFSEAAPRGVVQARCFDGLAHEIFNEPERAEVLAHLARWLAGISGPTSPGARPVAAAAR
jgi:alpha-beta hydrolase superfamily lysophospholipase